MQVCKCGSFHLNLKWVSRDLSHLSASVRKIILENFSFIFVINYILGSFKLLDNFPIFRNIEFPSFLEIRYLK